MCRKKIKEWDTLPGSDLCTRVDEGDREHCGKVSTSWSREGLHGAV